MDKTDDDDFFHPLGKPFWDEAARTTGATDLQVRFAACRFRGMTAARAARLAGYGGSDENIRQTGSKTAKSTAVMNLLALAAAEAGGGDEGIVGTKEAKRILSRLARGSDPSVRIKALDSLAKLEASELAANRTDELVDPDDIYRDMIVGLPVFGPLMAVAWFYAGGGWIGNFPFLTEVGPYLAATSPEDWARFRRNSGAHWFDMLDRVAAGPLLTVDEIVAAVKRPVRPKLSGTNGARPLDQGATNASA